MIIDLAEPGDPLVLPDGTEIADEAYENGQYVRPPSMNVTPKLIASRFRPDKRRPLADLPSEPKFMNGVNCVLVYTFFGLTDYEIAHALEITPGDVSTIRRHPAYEDMFDTVLDTLVNGKSQVLRARVASYGDAALDTVHEVMTNPKAKEGVRLSAARDLLDRADKHREASQTETANELRIVISDGAKPQEVSVTIKGSR